MPSVSALAISGEFGVVRSFVSGTQICSQGEAIVDVYLVRNGVIKLIWTDSEGGETIVGLRWPGSFVGASSHIAGLPSTTTAITLTDVSVEQITGERFHRLLQSDQNFSMRLQQAHSMEIIEYARGFGELALVPARVRLERLLRRLTVSARLRLPDGRLRLPLSKKELASLVCITPEHLSRTLEQMTAEGVIVTSGQWLIVPQVFEQHEPVL